MTTVCDSVRIKYKGNGSQKQFTFPFTYMHFYDITVGLWDEAKKEYVDQKNKFVLANATTIEFLTAPPAPSEAGIFNVLIGRNTDLTQMQATFYPGSSIRAEDLNDDFDQLRLAIQENRCAVEAKLDQLQFEFWSKKSMRSRSNYQVPQQPYDTLYRTDQEQQLWRPDGDQEAIPTTGAVAARLDPYVQEDLPVNPQVQQPGKRWLNTEDCLDGYWDPQANAWIAYANTGPRGAQGEKGEKGEKGDKGDPLTVKGVITSGDWNSVKPNTPHAGDVYVVEGVITNFPGGGTPNLLDGLVYTGSTWVNIGPLKGPKGDVGPAGPQGPTGPSGDDPNAIKLSAIGVTVQPYDANMAKLNVVQSFSKAQRGAPVVLTDGATVTPDFSLGNNFTLTLGGNRTLANPTNLVAGQSGCIVITNGGSNTLVYGNAWKFPGGTAPAVTANGVDVLAYYVESATRITARLVGDVK